MNRGAWWATVHEVAELDTTEGLSTSMSFEDKSPSGLSVHPGKTTHGRVPHDSATVGPGFFTGSSILCHSEAGLTCSCYAVVSFFLMPH